MNSRNLYTVILFILIFLKSFNLCKAQENTFDTLETNRIIEQYTNEDGLKQMEVEDIHFAKNGLLWIATRGGVCTFDGEVFDRFDDIDIKPLGSKKIQERSNGDIVIDAGRSLFVFNGDSFIEHPFPKSYKSTTYSSMIVDWEDNIWLQNRNTTEPYVFQDSIYQFSENFDHPFFSEISFIIPDNINECYYGIQDDKNIVKYCGGETEVVYQSSSEIIVWKNFQLSNNPNGFRFRNGEKGYQYFEFSTGRSYSLIPSSDDIDELSRNNVNIDVYDGNNLWINDRSQFVELLKGIKGKYNHFFCYERYGDNHYLGTGKGLVKISKSPFNIYPEEDFHQINFIRDVGDDTYFGSYGDGLISLSNHKVRNIPEVIGSHNGKCNDRNYYHPSLIGKDSLVVPTECGLYLLNKNVSKYMFPSLDEGNKPILFTYYDASRELIVVSTCPGVYILNKQFEVVKFLNATLIDHRCMLTTTQDDDGNYWLGGSGGVSKYDVEKNQVTNFSTADGSFPIHGAICSIKDEYGTLWFGSRDGLCMYDKEKQAFQKIEQFKNYSISSILQTDSNKYFLNTIDGLIMADLSAYSIDKEIQHTFYTKKSGFDALEPGQNGLYQDSNGLVWTSSATNVISFDPEDLKYNITRISPYIKSINGERASPNHKKAIKHGENTLKINYGSLGNSTRRQIQYRLRLNKSRWSGWTHDTSKEYQGLGSGTYEIDVQAKSISQNDKNSDITSAQVQISLPFNKEPYFNNLITSLLFVGLGGFLWLYQSKRNQKAMNQVLVERNELLADKNEGLLTEQEKLTRLNNALSSNLKSLTINQDSKIEKKIEISSFDKVYSLHPDQIVYLQSDKKITRVFLLDKPSIWSNQSLKYNYELLQDLEFIQIQRSTVINITHIEWINTTTLKMVDGTVLKIGRAYKTQFKSYIETMQK